MLPKRSHSAYTNRQTPQNDRRTFDSGCFLPVNTASGNEVAPLAISFAWLLKFVHGQYLYLSTQLHFQPVLVGRQI